MLKKENTALFLRSLGSNEMICVHSSKFKLAIYMAKYREIQLPETADPVGNFHKGNVSWTWKDGIWQRVIRSFRAWPFFVYCWKQERLNDVQNKRYDFVLFCLRLSVLDSQYIIKSWEVSSEKNDHCYQREKKEDFNEGVFGFVSEEFSF